jgi:phosphatidate cytidylyltransferase
MTRLLTAAVIITLLLGILYLPPIAFTLAICGVLVLAWHEYIGLCSGLTSSLRGGSSVALAVLVAASFAVGTEAVVVALLLAGPLLAADALRANYRDPGALTATVGASMAGLTWLAIPVGAQIGVRHTTNGALWLLFLYAAVAVGDSAAYYGGSRFGRHRLAPLLSPKKSIEGSVFGLLGSAAAGALVAHWLPSLSYAGGALAAAGLGLVGQAGDLLESALKRAAGQKDSSSLLPGHGGILDRIDAHLPAGVALYAALRAGWLG